MMLSSFHIKNVLETLLNAHQKKKKNRVLAKDVADLLVKQAAVQIRVLVPCEGFSD